MAAVEPAWTKGQGLTWGHHGDLASVHATAKDALAMLRSMVDGAKGAGQAAYARRLLDAEKHLARSVGLLTDTGNDVKATLQGGYQVGDLEA